MPETTDADAAAVGVDLAGSRAHIASLDLEGLRRFSDRIAVELVQARRDLRANEDAEDARLSIAEATIERLTGPEARERLARHLFIQAAATLGWHETNASTWDSGDRRINRAAWLVRADETLAVIASKDT